MSSSLPSSSQQRLLYIPRQNRRGHDTSPSLAPPTAGRSPSSSSVKNQDAGSTTSIGTRKRTRIQESNYRFHGAFTGGFSAGYYNTVGSSEGWQPTVYGASTESRKVGRGSEVPQQSIQSFMDEQDHNEWGGPRGVRNDFLSSEVDLAQNVGTMDSSTNLVTIHVRTGIGERLLRALGWRGSSESSAYVPVHKSFPLNEDHKADGSIEPSYQSILYSKRLRKIEMNRVNVNIPKPKVDLCGLGFEPFRDAPEFAQRLQARRKRAEFHARRGGLAPNARPGNRMPFAAAASYDDGYDDDHAQQFSRFPKSSPRTYLSEEHLHDFVGSRSAAGFALLDDEDDTYDDRNTRIGGLVVNSEEFDSELDANEEADQDNAAENAHLTVTVPSKEHPVKGIFSSWGTSAARPASTNCPDATVTSDGRPLLPAFELVATATSSTSRYRGPDVPPDFDVHPHLFGPREHPMIYEALLHAHRLQNDEDKYQNRVEEALHLNSVVPVTGTSTFSWPSHQAVHQDGPKKKAAFAGVSKAMATRFTSASGLQSPASSDAGEGRTAHDSTAYGAVTASRTFSTFAPTSLLCKRLRVPVPKNLGSVVSGTSRTKEESFFHDEILSRLSAPLDKLESLSARDQGSNTMSDDLVKRDQKVAAGAARSQVPPEPLRNDRPPIGVYKSIFEPSKHQLDKITVGAIREESEHLVSETEMNPESASHRSRFMNLSDSVQLTRQERLSAEDHPLDTPVSTKLSLDSVDDRTRKIRSERRRQYSIGSFRDSASESTGSTRKNSRRSDRRKARKQTQKKSRKKRKEEKRKRDHS